MIYELISSSLIGPSEVESFLRFCTEFYFLSEIMESEEDQMPSEIVSVEIAPQTWLPSLGNSKANVSSSSNESISLESWDLMGCSHRI